MTLSLFQACRRAAGVALLAPLALLLPAVSQPQDAAASPAKPAAQRFPGLKSGALATFQVEGERFRVWVTNPSTIQQLKDLRAGTSAANIPNGRIVRGQGKAGHNAPWRWHLDPKDIQMAEVTTEVCDGRPSYVNQHVDEFVKTVKRYCPWGAKLVGLRILSATSGSAPVAPTNVRIVSISKGTTSEQLTTVSLGWRDNNAGESGYRIHAAFSRLHGGADTQTKDLPASTSRTDFRFVAGGINPVRRACFTVTALSASAESSPSNQVCVQL
jgi:hypothetical protein